MTVRIRPAVEADVEPIADLEAECFPADAWPPGYLAEGVAGLLHGTVLHVAESDAAIVGHAITSIVFEIAELQRIAVTARLRRRGVARALLDAVRAEATRQGAERLLLEVRETNTGAIGFYEQAGFAEIDRRPRYYRDGSTAIVMSLDLENGSHG